MWDSVFYSKILPCGSLGSLICNSILGGYSGIGFESCFIRLSVYNSKALPLISNSSRSDITILPETV